MEYLFSNITAVTMQDDNPVIKNAYVHVKNEKIAYVGCEKPKEFSGKIIDGKNKVLMPGLINAHSHVPMTLLRGYADDYNLQDWLYNYIFPAEAKLDARSVSCASKLGIAEMIASGTTSFSDMYYFCDEIAKAVDESGIKANISRGITCFEPAFDFDSFSPASEARELVDKWNGFDDGRIKIDVSIHGEYTSYPAVWTAFSKFAESKGIGMHVHLSETKTEHEECIKRYGKTPAGMLEEYGVFNVRTTAAHCVWITDEDMEILKKHGVSAIHNPISNLKLASGIARVPEMISKGINVGLGTDGVSSNNSHDMFEEIKTAAIIHKTRLNDPTAMPALNALKLATVNGAVSQGREKECGKIEEGYDADLIMLDFDKPNLMPCHNPISNLVYAARGNDVVLNMVRGRILFENGEYKTLDMEKIKYEILNYGLKTMFPGN